MSERKRRRGYLANQNPAGDEVPAIETFPDDPADMDAYIAAGDELLSCLDEGIADACIIQRFREARQPTSEERVAESERPSYHDLTIQTAEIPETSIFDLPYGYEVSCTRASGWCLCRCVTGSDDMRFLAGEYGEKWLVLRVNGTVIVDSRPASEVSKNQPISSSGKH